MTLSDLLVRCAVLKLAILMVAVAERALGAANRLHAWASRVVA